MPQSKTNSSKSLAKQHSLLLLFYSFRDERELLSGWPPLYQSQLLEQGVQAVVHIKDFSKFNENLISNQDPHS